MRPGHHRPIGTTTRIGILMNGDRDPQLGDIVLQVPGPDGDPDTVRRAFEVVGVEEPGPAGRWGIVLERLEYADAITRSLDAPWWCFYRTRQ